MSLREEWTRLRQSPQRTAFLDRIRSAATERRTIGIFSSTTWRPIVASLEGELLIEGIEPQVEIVEYEAVAGALARDTERFDVAVLALDDAASYGALYAADEKCRIEPIVAAVLSRVDRLLARCSQLIVVLPSIVVRAPRGLDVTVEGESLSQRLRRFAFALEVELESRAGVVALELDAVLADLGCERAYDARMWEMGRIRYSQDGFNALARALAPIVLAGSGRGIKAIVLDLDNTLWGGVIGEDGIEGIELGGDYPGSCFREFQRELLRFRRAGMLIAVASKNNETDALDAIENHPEMLIQSSDIDHAEIHWEPKPVSIGRILDTFNIGADAILFIDDNPREREAVAKAYPRLRIFDFPDDPIDLVANLQALPWLALVASSEEDRRRGELRRQQSQRAKAREENTDYLGTLAIELDIRVDDPADTKRAAQLHQKTNQFNVRPIRHGETDIARAISDPASSVVTVRYRDNFGEAGIIAVAVVRHGAEPVAETLLLSCRVIGLGVEHALLAHLTADGPLRIPYRVTEKNAPALEFLASIGSVSGESGEVVAEGIEIPSWVTVHAESKEITHAR